MHAPRKPLIGVMGAGEGASPADRRLAEELGGAIARRGWALLSGGRPEGDVHLSRWHGPVVQQCDIGCKDHREDFDGLH